MPKKSADSQIKRILKLWRLGWTQKRIASACFCSQGHVSAVETKHGRRRKRLAMGYEPYRVPAAMTNPGVRHKVYYYD